MILHIRNRRICDRCRHGIAVPPVAVRVAVGESLPPLMLLSLRTARLCWTAMKLCFSICRAVSHVSVWHCLLLVIMPLQGPVAVPLMLLCICGNNGSVTC